MAGRGRLPPPMHHHQGRGPPLPMRGGVLPYGGGIPPPQALIEEKLTTQHIEIQRLLTENQRLAATHIALRQELASAQQEVQRFQQVIGGIQAEKDQQLRGIVEKTGKMEADLRNLESLKVELQRAQGEVQKLIGNRQELSSQIQQMTQEMHRIRAEAQQVPALKLEIDGFRQEIQRARTAFEFEKKANTELLEQRTAMEKNLVSMAREVEKLRAELTNVEKKSRAGGFVGAYGTEAVYSSVMPYGDGYAMNQIGSVAENPAHFTAGVAPNWGGYDMQRGGARR